MGREGGRIRSGMLTCGCGACERAGAGAGVGGHKDVDASGRVCSSLRLYGAPPRYGHACTHSIPSQPKSLQPLGPAGLSLITYLLIANNAAQGVLSSFFYKFAGALLEC